MDDRLLKQRGCESPRLDAEVLLAEARGCQRIELYTAFHESPGEEVRGAFRELVRRRAAGVPVAYLVGRREFYSLSFLVTPDVLIPRPETELLVVELLDLLKPRQGGKEAADVVDVGAGSGVIAVCAAKHAPHCRVLAVDSSPAALAVARENARRHGVADRIEFAEGDLLTAVPDDRRFDFVVSNPPYVSDSELAQAAPEVRDHEPRAALAAGPTGVEVIARLTPQAAERLRPGGWLILEISPMIERQVHDCIAASGQFQTPLTVRDLAGRPRVVKAQRRPQS